MSGSGQAAQDAAGVGGIRGFAENFLVDGNNGVGGEDDALRIFRGDGRGLGSGQFGRQFFGGPVLPGGDCVLIEIRGVDLEVIAGGAQEGLPARGGAGENQNCSLGING